MDYAIRIGGPAGAGVEAIGGLVAGFLARSGCHLCTRRDYMCRIRGGHNFFQIRLADRPVTTAGGRPDILVALDRLTLEIHASSLTDKGLILHDAALRDHDFQGRRSLAVDPAGIADRLRIDRIMTNSVAAGAILGLLGLEPEPLYGPVVAAFFPGRTDGVIATNVAAARAGRDHVRQQLGSDHPWPVTPAAPSPLMLLNGNQAMGFGALTAGCAFFAASPMQPAIGIMNWLAAKAEEHGIVVEQAEDEPAAIHLALGASHGGVRAMTATSGPGFALMTEGISLAGATGTPLVVALVQRCGPGVGMPTRTGQGDLLAALHGGQGEFPRAVLAPGSPEQAIFLTNKAFHLAEKYQLPVIVLSDQDLADSARTHVAMATDRLVYEDFRQTGPAQAQPDSHRPPAANHHPLPRLTIPGESKHLVVKTGYAHDQTGRMNEDKAIEREMVHRRLREKMALLAREISPPAYYGAPEADIVLIGHGSTLGVLLEVLERLTGAAGNEVDDTTTRTAGLLHFSEIYPFPLTDRFDYLRLLHRAGRTICVENNATGQFARLLRAEAGFTCSNLVLGYDGRPFDVETLLGKIDALL